MLTCYMYLFSLCLDTYLLPVMTPRTMSQWLTNHYIVYQLTQSIWVLTNITKPARWITCQYVNIPNLAAGSQHARHSPSPLIRSPSTPKYPIYDFLTPRGTKCALDKEEPGETPTTKEPEEEDSYVCLRPPIESDKRTSPDGQDSSFYSHPVLSDEVLHHHYEYLSPLKDEAADDDSYESYVYMAPRKDYPQRPQNVSPLPITPTTRYNRVYYINI